MRMSGRNAPSSGALFAFYSREWDDSACDSMLRRCIARGDGAEFVSVPPHSLFATNVVGPCSYASLNSSPTSWRLGALLQCFSAGLLLSGLANSGSEPSRAVPPSRDIPSVAYRELCGSIVCCRHDHCADDSCVQGYNALHSSSAAHTRTQ